MRYSIKAADRDLVELALWLDRRLPAELTLADLLQLARVAAFVGLRARRRGPRLSLREAVTRELTTSTAGASKGRALDGGI